MFDFQSFEQKTHIKIEDHKRWKEPDSLSPLKLKLYNNPVQLKTKKLTNKFPGKRNHSVFDQQSTPNYDSTSISYSRNGSHAQLDSQYMAIIDSQKKSYSKGISSGDMELKRVKKASIALDGSEMRVQEKAQDTSE